MDLHVYFIDCADHNHTGVEVARKLTSKGMNILYSLCLKYEIDITQSNICERLSNWSQLWHYLALSNKFISKEMVKSIIDDLVESNLSLNVVYKLLSTLNDAGQCHITIDNNFLISYTV